VTDAYHLDSNVGNIVGTRRQRALITGTYELPFGRDRAWGRHASPAVNALIGGWDVSTVTLVQTGPFLTPTISPAYDAANVNALGRGTIVRPDLIGSPTLAHPTPDAWWNINAFAPAPLDAGRVGNARVGSLEGPGTCAVAAGFAKTFGLGAHARGRLELTVTNLFNRVNYAPPATDIGTPATFGKTTSAQTAENAGHRTGQLAFRVAF